MGDEAESVFEYVWPKGYARYGLDRPPIHVHKLPPFIRYTPDYITSDVLVEVQGFGKDRKVKVKHDKLEALIQWDQIYPTVMFLWNSADKLWGTVDLPELYVRLKKKGAVDAFDGGRNPYRWMPYEALGIDWTPHTEPDDGHYDVV